MADEPTDKLAEQLEARAKEWGTGFYGYPNADSDLDIEAAQRLRALQQAVDALPHTADGVPVVPGMVLYYRSPTGVIKMPKLKDWDDVVWAMEPICGGPPMYATREAVERAERGGEG